MKKLFFVVPVLIFLLLGSHDILAQKRVKNDTIDVRPNNSIITTNKLQSFDARNATPKQIENYNRFIELYKKVNALWTDIELKAMNDEQINSIYHAVYYSMDYLYISERFEDADPVLDMVELFCFQLKGMLNEIDELNSKQAKSKKK